MSLTGRTLGEALAPHAWTLRYLHSEPHTIPEGMPCPALSCPDFQTALKREGEGMAARDTFHREFHLLSKPGHRSDLLSPVPTY